MHYLFTLLFTIIASFTFAQDDLLAGLEAEDSVNTAEVVFIKNTWKSPYLINFHTTETERKGILDFRISHRFGNMVGPGAGGHSLFGLDQASNIRFSFDYGITDDFQIGLGRSALHEHIDFLIKYKLLKQKKDKMPISLVLLNSTALTPKKDVNNYFSQFAHRFSFINQVIIGSKINNRLSVMFNASHFHRNLIIQQPIEVNNPDDANSLFVAGAAARYRLTKKLSLVGEYNQVFSKLRNSDNFNFNQPLSLGVEIETGGHVFHINISNSAGLIQQDLYNAGIDDWADGEIKLGFTISRFFAI